MVYSNMSLICCRVRVALGLVIIIMIIMIIIIIIIIIIISIIINDLLTDAAHGLKKYIEMHIQNIKE